MLSTSSRARVDLNSIVMGHAVSLTQFALPRILPIKVIDKPTARQFAVKAGSLLDAPDTDRAPGSDFPRDNYDVDSSTVTTKGKGLEAKIPTEQTAEYADILPLEAHRAKQKVAQMFRREELGAATTLFSRGTFPVAAASGHDATNEWDDHSAATPVDDVLTAIEALEDNIGDWRDLGLQVCLAATKKTIRHCKLCAQVRSGLGGIYTDPEFKAAEPSDALLATALNVDEIVPLRARYRSGGSAAVPVVSKIWSDEFALVYVRANPDAPEQMGLGLTYVWTPGGGEIEIYTYFEDKCDSQIVQVKRQSTREIVQSGAGYLIGNLKS